jgi:hypothetical protein
MLQYSKEHSGRPVPGIYEPCMSDVSRILSQIEDGDAKAAAQLLRLAYDEFSKTGSRETGSGKTGLTLQATALMKHTCDL